ncbi:MAG: ATP-grasp domain-containing protein [Chitinivibrionales bacterium]|nr:ATP-grasp domain-containing protein [Chitinivibrionales bacterium]
MSFTVAISGINAVDNPGPGTGIARSLKESGLQVRTIGLAYDSLEPGIYMDWIIDKSYILPYPSCDANQYLQRLEYIHNHEKLDIIISALDAELPLFINLLPKIRSMGIKLMIPSRDSFKKRSKDKLDELSAKIGIKTPKSYPLLSLVELDRALEDIGYPCMIKGPFYEAYKVSAYGEAQHYFHQLAMRWGYPIIAQKFIYGEEYNLIGLGDGEGNDLGHVATKKMIITKQGKIWTNISIKNEQMEVAAQKFVTALKWCGGYELELMLEYKTNELYIIEINPRFPAWVYMATGCGINLPMRMVQKLMNLDYETHSDYQAGTMLMRYTGEMVKSIADFEKMTTLGEH